MSGRSQSIRFVNGRIYRDASDRMMPGLTDAHIHLFGLAAERLQIRKAAEAFN
ncbi:putative amidohydrolase YtcJ [Bradyrhizobium yuanmingense]|uniref:Amidohydrolase YtcJ n=1 Tax=Bradyrhizobium yuanmingense TaxID=108015 RepID=A0ABV4GA58_9BRAD|nr:hypothetical protein [Bradyrhizobium yuanmingense]